METFHFFRRGPCGDCSTGRVYCPLGLGLVLCVGVVSGYPAVITFLVYDVGGDFQRAIKMADFVVFCFCVFFGSLLYSAV